MELLLGRSQAFTRSLGETGVILVVMGADRTIPVLIVDWSNKTLGPVPH